MATVAKFAIITGSNTGLGLHLAKALYTSGIYSSIVLACRNMEKGEQAIEEIKSQKSTAAIVEGNLPSLQCLQVRTFFFLFDRTVKVLFGLSEPTFGEKLCQ